MDNNVGFHRPTFTQERHKSSLSWQIIFNTENGIYSPPKKKSTTPAAEIVIREALKLGLQNHYVDGVPALLASAELLKGVNEEQFDGPRSRSKIGTRNSLFSSDTFL